jgi:diguanylate cyclase (GGDEF)-like protein
LAAIDDTTLDPQLERSRLANALVNGTGDLEDQFDAAALLQSFADILVAATPHFPLVWFYIGDPHASRITPQYCAGVERSYGESLVVDRSPLMMRGPVRRALESGETVIQDIPERLGTMAWLLPGVRQWHRRAWQAGVRSVLALPFALTESDHWGLTVVYADTPGYFDTVGLNPMQALSRMARVGLDRVALREAEQRTRIDLEHARRRDPVTGLLNQAGFEERWSQWPIADGHVALLVQLDIDNFSALNAGLGERAGDEALQGVAQRLADWAGDDALVARCAADTFLVGLATAAPEQSASHVEALQTRISETLPVAGRELALSATAGYALAAGEQPRPSTQAAAAAQHQAQRLGPGTRCRHQGGEAPRSEAPQDLLGRLRRAMTRDELALFYQPQVRLADANQILAAEALIRWYRDDGTLVPPGEFIPAVENSAMIRDIGCWVMAEVGQWLAGQGADAVPVVGINIGARHLLHPRFLEDVDAILGRYPEVGQRLMVEITETAALTDAAGTRHALAGLRERGIGVALDDFGTGFASYSQLASLPIDQIKIDRRFIDGLDQAPRQFALVESLLVAAEGLGLEVVAEGIERRAEAEVLSGMGCRIGQGYAYAHPMDEFAFVDWLGPCTRASAIGVPEYDPVVGLVWRWIASLHALENGDESVRLGPVPAWFRGWVDNDTHGADAIRAIDAYHQTNRQRGGVPADVLAATRASLQAFEQKLRR